MFFATDINGTVKIPSVLHLGEFIILVEWCLASFSRIILASFSRIGLIPSMNCVNWTNYFKLYNAQKILMKQAGLKGSQWVHFLGPYRN